MKQHETIWNSKEAGAVQAEEEKALGRPASNLSVSKGGDRHLSKICCNGKRGNGFKPNEGRLRLAIRKQFVFFLIISGEALEFLQHHGFLLKFEVQPKNISLIFVVCENTFSI